MRIKTVIRHFIIVISLAFTSQLSAQDPILSQFYNLPELLNPGFAGLSLAPRIAAAYRNQWPQLGPAYVTGGVSVGQYFEGFNSGLGLSIMTDDAGEGIYKTTQARFSYSYTLTPNRKIRLKLGTQVGINHSRLDWSQLVFLQDIDPIYGNQNTSVSISELQPDNTNSTNLTISAGGLLHTNDFYIGLAANHLNRPDDRVLPHQPNLYSGLPILWSAQLGGHFELDKYGTINLDPGILWTKQADFQQLNGGMQVDFKGWMLGLWYRHAFGNGDAGIVSTGYRYRAFKIMYSYDYTTSNLNGYTGGAHEIGIVLNLENAKDIGRRRKSYQNLDCFGLFK